METKRIRITFRTEIYVDAKGETPEELLDVALAEWGKIDMFSQDAVENHGCEFVELVSVENETDGEELY